MKGNPHINTNIDCDVLVSAVRETSRKPDELYDLVERMSPGGKKVELFARPHNRKSSWLSLGNQLPGTYVYEDDLIKRWNQAHPDEQLDKQQMETNKLTSVEIEYEDSPTDENSSLYP